ncbi:hypothetical protein [Legionella cardiaca]|uniref:Uncharacterized protein n=1 Tax=Legionella cardiaca TaxID=1071983 RepID=A0ABY8AQH1_9GAMM|nr:hypothetical protein [Legionella cardiaca]WED42788.1 hypothetical protein PXX05_12925 [Legionella cardiaca]
MGWWDTWTTVRDTATGWGKSVWENASLSGAASGIFNFSYNTIGRLLEQIPAVPRVLRSTIITPSVTKMVKGMGRIAVEDVMPLVVISYTMGMLQQQMQDYSEEYSENDVSVATQTALQMGVWLLWAANYAYSFRKKTQIVARTTVLVMEAGSAFNSIRETPPMDLCVTKKHDTLRFLKGSFRDIIEYWATKGAIFLISYVPVVGGGVSVALEISLNGRYVTTLIIPELCQPDQERFLRQYPEFALAHGISHFLVSKGICYLIEKYTGIPAVFYETTVQQFALIGQIGIASQMTLPPAVAESNRNMIDPVAAYQGAIGFTVDTFGLGLKQKVPEMLKKQTEPLFTWKNITDYSEILWCNPLSEYVIKPVFVPRMLRSGQAFADDPVIPWPSVRKRIISASKNIKDVKAHPLTTVALISPGTTAEIARPIFGTPKFIVELLLNLMKNEEFMRQVGKLRNYAGGLHRGKPPSLPSTEGTFPLRGQEKDITPELTSMHANVAVTLDPRSIILPHSPTLRVMELPEDSEKKENKEPSDKKMPPKVIKLKPSDLIKREVEEDMAENGTGYQPGMFKKLDPKMIILRQRHTSEPEVTTATITN